MADPSQLAVIANILNNPWYTFLYLVLIVWTLIWKGIALWKSGRNGQRNWFIAMLILNTAGILEIIYIFYFSKPKSIEKTPQ